MRFKPLVLVLALGVAGFAHAKSPVTGEIQAFIVSKNSEGIEKVLPAKEAAPGQVMEFQIVFTNNGDSDVKGIKVVDPIPANTLFIGDSHSADVPATFQVSIDGGASFEGVPVVRYETQADGTEKKIVIPPEQYTHVRWVADEELPSKGGKHRYSYRVSVK
jgi:uncharacterized repeat protein (TIGR01451 family)